MTNNEDFLKSLPPDLQSKLMDALDRSEREMKNISTEAENRKASARLNALVQEHINKTGRRPDAGKIEEFKAFIRKTGHPNYY